MTPSRFEAPMVGDAEVGDLWRVSHIEGETVTFERVVAEHGTFRRKGDGLWPRWSYPDTRPLSDAEALRLADEMDAGLKAEVERLVSLRLQNEALMKDWAKPVGASGALITEDDGET